MSERLHLGAIFCNPSLNWCKNKLLSFSSASSMCLNIIKNIKPYFKWHACCSVHTDDSFYERCVGIASLTSGRHLGLAKNNQRG